MLPTAVSEATLGAQGAFRCIGSAKAYVGEQPGTAAVAIIEVEDFRDSAATGPIYSVVLHVYVGVCNEMIEAAGCVRG